MHSAKYHKFHLVSLRWSFLEMHSGNSAKLCVSTKCPHQEIRWNCGICCSDGEQETRQIGNKRIPYRKTYYQPDKNTYFRVFLERGHCLKSVRIRSFSGPYFPAFGLNMERYEVSLGNQSKCRKIRTRKTSNTNTFYAVTWS